MPITGNKNNMKYKMLILDIDDTLVPRGGGISQKNAAAIQKAREAGVYVTLATGRGYYGSSHVFRELGLDTYVINYAGAVINDTRTDKPIFVTELDNSFVQEILAMAFDNYCKIIGYETAIPVIKEWLKSDCANTRRAVSEGLRIWTSRPYFKEHPQMAIQFLSSLKDDESEYVRKSIGNALKDISKKYPELVSNELEQWDLSSKEIKQVHKLASAYLNKS